MDWMAVKAANRELSDRETSQKLTRLKSRPLFFWLAIGGPCNLECAHCGFRKFGRTSDLDISDAVYEKVLEEVFPTAYECLLGGENWGEMTISSKFHRVLKDAKRYQVKVHLTTTARAWSMSGSAISWTR
ncbi:MAG: hypothetical protein ABR606_07965 [Vicinamibacterales bacterium]